MSSTVSLFEMTRNAFDQPLPTIQCSKATLVHISHTLENVVLKHQLPALMFTGFQESSHWSKESKRYLDLAGIAQQICIFAGKPLPEAHPAEVLQIELEGEDPLRQEWFVIIISDAFCALLTGKDQQFGSDPLEESWRTFDTILNFDPDVLNPVLNALDKVIAHYRPDLLEDLRANRQRFSPLRNDSILLSNVITELVSFEEDLNQHLRGARDEARVERDFNRMLIDTMISYALTISADGQIASANPALCQKLAFTLDQLVGQTWEQFLAETYRAQMAGYRDHVLATGDNLHLSAPLVTPHGVQREVEWHLARIDLPQQPSVLFIMGHDVTEIRLAEALRRDEAVLRAQLEKERQLRDLRSQFITTVSHEFRTPLSTILNNVQMLDRHVNTEDAFILRRIDKIKRQVHTLNDMVDEISGLVHVGQDELDFAPEPQSINHLTRTILASIEDQAVSAEGRLEFQSALENDVTLMVDARLLRFILSNLIGNALKYSPQSEPVEITLKLKDQRLIYKVSDRGDGIPESDRAHLFEAFYRGSNVGQTRGTGLGLRIVRECVHIWGGTVTYRTAGTGTTFIVRLPIKSDSAASD